MSEDLPGEGALVADGGDPAAGGGDGRRAGDGGKGTDGGPRTGGTGSTAGHGGSGADLPAGHGGNGEGDDLPGGHGDGTPLSTRGKLLVLLAGILVLALVGGVAVWRAAGRADRKNQVQAGGPAVHAGDVSLAPGAGPRIVFRSMAWGPHRDELASVPAADPDGPRTASGVKCLRFYAAGGTGVCLQAERGAVSDSYRALVLDDRLRTTRHVDLAGIPTRARVSPSGRMAAWTVFVGGDSYAGTDFSTRTSILDTRTGALQPTLEDYALTRDGKRVRAADLNYWGVTFADDTHFYATAATGGHTYLIRGDVATRTAITLRTNVECPSLSPDGTRIAFKKRVPGLDPDAPWRLYVLDLATLKDHPTAETRNVDDQAVWVDGGTLSYSLPGDYGSDLFTVPADGTGAPALLTPSALSPAWLG